jgi:hypothetical protein
MLNRLDHNFACAGKRSSKHNQLKAKVTRIETRMSNINESLVRAINDRFKL